MSDGVAPTSASAVLSVAENIRIPLKEFTFTFARSSGAGGQNVNKVNSKAVMRWNLLESPSIPEDVRDRFLARFGGRLTEDGDLVIMAEEYRDQVRNRETCIQRLAAMLLQVARPAKKRIKTKPTKSAKRKRLRAKREHSEKKHSRTKVDWGDD